VRVEIERVARVAVISDVHGNAPALEAVLREVEALSPDVVLNLGCLTYGPQPREVVALLQALSVPVLSIRGNGDRAVLEMADDGRAPHDERAAFVRDAHDAATLAMLRTTAATHELEVTGLGRVVFCHGSPRSDIELVTPETTPDRLHAAVSDHPCDVVVTGHTHLQFRRQLPDLLSIGAGSVGLPYHDGPLGARWAVLGPEVELRVTAYDLGAAVDAAARVGLPNLDAWRAVVTTPPTFDEVLADAESRQFSD
jgi:putative phosphoesterase